MFLPRLGLRRNLMDWNLGAKPGIILVNANMRETTWHNKLEVFSE